MDYTGRIITKNAVTPTQTSASGVWTLQDQILAQQSNTWPVPGVYNPISRSLRFNSADSAYLNRTPSTAGNRKTWTWSGWVKRSAISGTAQGLLQGYSSNTELTALRINGSEQVSIQDYYSGGSVNLLWATAAVLRDVSSFYHLVISFDTTQATAANCVKIYINGVSQTVNYTAASGSYSQNRDAYVNAAVAQHIGRYESGFYLNGYLTEVNFIDGQALTASSFGTTDPQTGVWVPIAYTGTYGTNGFYLNFKDNTSTTTIGYDYSGNGNNWTTNNFSVSPGSGNDSLTDTPTPWVAFNTSGDIGGVVRGNYATFNAVAKASAQPTFSNGNLDLSASAAWNGAIGTIGVTSGKWYWEVVNGNADSFVGICGSNLVLTTADPQTLTGNIVYYGGTGSKRIDGTDTAYGASYSTETIGVALDVDGGTVTFYKSNVSQGSINLSLSTLNGKTIFPFFVKYASTATVNFGQRPFAYTPPSGYKSLCTTNLPTPTIGATSTTTAGKYFNAVLYSGNSSTQNITGVGFQPDLVWTKSRTTGSTNHVLTNSVVGTVSNLYSNLTNSEGTRGVTAFQSDGFQYIYPNEGGDANVSGQNYVAWNWNAGGSNATNTSGTITSTVRANTTAGFSIVTYTGTGANATVGHGLGVAPSMIIIKNRQAANSWVVYHTSTGNGNVLLLNSTNASTADATAWNNTSPTSTLFSLGTGAAADTNQTTGGGNHVAYCFAAVAGYSAFGSYTGNGSADGPFVYTGFRPRYVMIKRTNSTSNWWILDTARDTYNVADRYLYAESSDAEDTRFLYDFVDILSNGFKLRSSNSTNTSSATFIYMAFAESPFKYSLAR